MPPDTPIDEIGSFGDLEFRELADNAPVMIWRSRPDKQCDWFNKPWMDYAGKSLDQLAGYGWAEDVHPEDYDRCVATYVQAFDARQKFTMPYRLRRHDGVYRWFLDNGAPFYRGGEFAGYFGSCVDITEQRNLEEHQRTLLAELNHGVKNNLQLIISFLHLSMLRASTAEAKSLLDAAIRRVQGVGVIQDELYKTASGAVDLGAYLANLTQTVLTAEGNGRTRLETDVQSIPVPIDLATNLGLIINELVINSIKHSRADTVAVRLSVKQADDGRGDIVVADNGVGFPDDTAPNNESRFPGSGFGLVAAIGKRCNAEISRANSDGAVTRISFPIPEND